MEIKQHLVDHAGVYAIGAMVTAISAIEVLTPQTISTGYDRILSGEYGRLARTAVVLGSIATFCHTLNIFDAFGLQSIDPIHQFGKRVLARTAIERLSLGYDS